MSKVLIIIILLHVVFILGCSQDIVYNGNTQQNKLHNTLLSDSNDKKTIASIENGIFVGVNKFRSNKGLNILVRHTDLDSVARAYSKAMARTGNISHVDPDGKSMEDRLDAAGITEWSSAGENLASSTVGAEPVQSALWGWEQSQGHLENILYESYVYTGVGAYRDPKTGEVFITQLFMSE